MVSDIGILNIKWTPACAHPNPIVSSLSRGSKDSQSVTRAMFSQLEKIHNNKRRERKKNPIINKFRLALYYPVCASFQLEDSKPQLFLAHS